MPKRVLFCRVDGNFGGVERHILAIASSLNRERYQPLIAAIASHGALEEKAKTLGMETEFISMPRRMALSNASNQLAKICQTHNIDVIHTFGIRSNTLAWMIKRKVNIPWVITLPNINSTDYESQIRGWIAHQWNNYLLRHADAVHVISSPLHRYIASILCSPKNVYTIVNGVEIPPNLEQMKRSGLHEKYGLPDDVFVIGSSGRLEPVKGYDLLLKAVKPMIKTYPNVRLMLVGNGSQRSTLSALAASLEIADKVIFTGYTDDIWQHLTGMDLYVCSSRSEGVPYSVLEALAVGLPVIATNVGGMGDLIQHDENGVLIPPNDADALSNAMIHLLSNPNKSNALSEAAKKRVEHEFTAQRMTDSIQTMYDEMIEKKSS